MTQLLRRNGIIAILFVIIGLASLVRADYILALAALSVAVSYLLFAPPISRTKRIAAYAFTAIALVSILAWLYFAFLGSPAPIH